MLPSSCEVLSANTGGCLDAAYGRSTHQLACQVQEGLLIVVVGLGGDLVVLQVLLAVEGDLKAATATQPG